MFLIITSYYPGVYNLIHLFRIIEMTFNADIKNNFYMFDGYFLKNSARNSLYFTYVSGLLMSLWAFSLNTHE